MKQIGEGRDVKSVKTYSVIPERNRVGLPLEANLEVRIFRKLAEEECEDRI